MVNFDFLEKGLEVVSPPHFVYYFSKKKKCLMLYYALLTDQILFHGLSLPLEVFVNICIAIVCLPCQLVPS